MKIGHFNNFIILISGVLRNKKGEILLIRRSNANKTFRGFWQLPEGKMEFGEQPIEALKREVKEELGCRLINAKPIVANSAIVTFQGTSYHVLRIVLEAQLEGTPTLSSEHDAYQWFNLKKAIKIPKLVDGIREILLTL